MINWRSFSLISTIHIANNILITHPYEIVNVPQLLDYVAYIAKKF